jgi:hypothetical protein
MNPTLKAELIEQALQDDYEGAKNLYLAEFRSDIETFVRREVVESCVIPERFELPPIQGVRYVGFADPSGGSVDSMTLGIAHREGDTLILDCLRESKPPFSPDSVVKEFAEVLKSYGLATVTGDKYGGIWPSERFEVHAVDYQISALAKSDIYREFLPLANSGQIELLDSDRLVDQLCNLERKVARGGRDSIDGARGSKDDLANVTAGALTMLAGKEKTTFNYTFIDLNSPTMGGEDTCPATGLVDAERVPMLKATEPRQLVECRLNDCTQPVLEGCEYCLRHSAMRYR